VKKKGVGWLSKEKGKFGGGALRKEGRLESSRGEITIQRRVELPKTLGEKSEGVLEKEGKDVMKRRNKFYIHQKENKAPQRRRSCLERRSFKAPD